MHYLLTVLGIWFGEMRLKHHVEEHWDIHRTHTPPEGSFLRRLPVKLRRCHNYGAFLNLGQYRKQWVLLLSVLFTACLSVFFLTTLFQRGNGLLKAGLSLLLGGAFSNTYDRLKRGYVVDYFSLQTPFPKLNSVVFNLADFAILTGALIITASELRK